MFESRGLQSLGHQSKKSIIDVKRSREGLSQSVSRPVLEGFYKRGLFHRLRNIINNGIENICGRSSLQNAERRSRQAVRRVRNCQRRIHRQRQELRSSAFQRLRLRYV